MKVFVKGNKMRMEMTLDGQAVIILVDNSSRTSIKIIGNTGIKQAWQEQDTPTGQASDIISCKPVIIGEETFDGKLCTLIEYTYNDPSLGTLSAKAWIWKQHGFPLKIESTNSMGEIATTLYKNVVVGGIIPDSMFEVPSGVVFVSGLSTAIPN